jgi:23S rRNA (guanosine2251-2'-O)-methyltransferase
MSGPRLPPRNPLTPWRWQSDRESLHSTASGRQPPAPERWLYGRHAVTAALANPERRWRRLAVAAGHENEGAVLLANAKASRLRRDEALWVLDRDSFAALLPAGAVHQGLALEVEALSEPSLETVLREVGRAPGRMVVLLLDGVTDPHNLGAVLRSAAAFGGLAVVVPARHAAAVSGTLAKAASGALEIVPLVRAVNLARTIDRLKAAEFWICGLDEAAARPLARLDLGARVALVLGSEGGGMRRLVRERCDFLARLPTRPAQTTLNVSNAAAVALYELLQRSG